MTKSNELPIQPGKRLVYLDKGIPVLTGFVKKCVRQGERLYIYLRQGWSEYVRGRWQKVTPPETYEQASPILYPTITFDLDTKMRIKEQRLTIIIEFPNEESIRIAREKSNVA